MNDEQQGGRPGMSEEFKARMRQGLSTMAVRERVRERRRNRAIAGGALAAVVVCAVAVFGSQALGNLSSERDQAAPPTPTAPTETAQPTAEPTAEPTPEETAPASPTPPPGFEGVAAGEPLVLDHETCVGGCGDVGAGGGPPVERTFDVYLVCEGSGSVSYGGELWVDCAGQATGAGFVRLGVLDTVDDGDPQFTTSGDFNGRLAVVDAGAPPVGDGAGGTATVWVTCHSPYDAVTVGGVLFDCGTVEVPQDELLVRATMAAWGVPILPGEIAPRIEQGESSTAEVSFVVER